ncbi:MAG TPA: hypothetical protein VOA88_05925 [Candidatus Dormibacteraeota bacterium]|nr:hypothetical protein [Candidatus Dormibacteraeota bacterium]
MPDKSPEDAEEIYRGFRESVGCRTSDARIYSLTFWDLDKEVKARVGYPDPLEGRMVMAMLEADNFYLTWAKGRGYNHMMIDKVDVTNVEKFDPPGPTDAPK